MTPRMREIAAQLAIETDMTKMLSLALLLSRLMEEQEKQQEKLLCLPR